MQPCRLRAEGLLDPVGLGEARPQLSWELESDRQDDFQSRYQVVVSSDEARAAAGLADVWSSGEVLSPTTFGVEYRGPKLQSGQRCYWAVRVWDADGAPSRWSEPAVWEMGLLRPEDWVASWIAPPGEVSAPVQDVPPRVDLGDWRGVRPCYLRMGFEARGPVARARAYVSAQGVYELWINGARVGTDLLRPGWTDYRIRIPYQVYDVTPHLQAGSNRIGALLGSGWFCGRVAWEDRVYGESPSLLIQLRVEYLTGAGETVVSGAGWESAPAPLLWSDLLMGEGYDARLERPSWCCADDDSTGWLPCVVVQPPAAKLVAQVAPPVRVLAERRVTGVLGSGIGRWVFDLGQNFAGWVRLRCRGDAGTVVALRFAEALNNDGSLYTANLRTAAATDVVVLREGETVFEPKFTLHGFRYVEIDGLPGSPDPDVLTGVVAGTDLARAGAFECSSPLVTQLQHNIEWSLRGNFVEIPTDCPQRDERLGWTADLQVFLPTACCIADVHSFLTKWLTDLMDTGRPDGAVGDVAPLVRPNLFGRAAPGWGDAVVAVPWFLYRTYGDLRLLRRCFPAMVGWVDYVAAANPDRVWRYQRGNDYGDWLSVGADTPRELVATAYHAFSAGIVAQAAGALGEARERDRFVALAEEIRAAFAQSYLTPDGRVLGDTQTGYALALAFHLLPEGLRAAAGRNLAADVRRRGWHLSTGFLGVAHLLPALGGTGHFDVAYSLLEQDSFPSWGYQIRQGATTLWERWDGRTEAGVHADTMNSFNHYAFGSVGVWLYEAVAGLAQCPDSVGFERLLVHPHPGGSLRWARAYRDTVRGRASVSWVRSTNRFELEVGVPPGADAEVRLPDGSEAHVGSGRHRFAVTEQGA